jgi:hypothetical protein
LSALSQQVDALSHQLSTLAHTAHAEHTSHTTATAILQQELLQMEAHATAAAPQAQLGALRAWWRDALPDDLEQRHQQHQQHGVAGGGSISSDHPLSHAHARREHVAALRALLGERVTSESALVATLTRELAAEEERSERLLRELADERSCSQLSSGVEIAMADVREADARLLTLQAMPCEIKQKGKRKSTQPHHHAHAFAHASPGAPATPATPATPAAAASSADDAGGAGHSGGVDGADGRHDASLTALESLLDEATQQLQRHGQQGRRQHTPSHARTASAPTPSQVPRTPGHALTATSLTAADERGTLTNSMPRLVRLRLVATADPIADAHPNPTSLTDMTTASEVAKAKDEAKAEAKAAVAAAEAAAAEAAAVQSVAVASAEAAARSAAQKAVQAAKAEGELLGRVRDLEVTCTQLTQERATLRSQLSAASDELAARRSAGASNGASGGASGDGEGAALRAQLERAHRLRDAAQADAAAAQADAAAAHAAAHAAQREAERVRAESTSRAEEQAALVGRIEAQLLEQMSRSIAAQQALQAAEAIQRQLDAAAHAGGGGAHTIVLLPE